MYCRKRKIQLLERTESSDISRFPVRIKEIFLERINYVRASQDIPDIMKRILLVLLPKLGGDLQLLNSDRPVYLKIINTMVKITYYRTISKKIKSLTKIRMALSSTDQRSTV